MELEKRIEQANEEVIRRWNESDVVLKGIASAAEIDGFHTHLILHAGPPIQYEDMCNPMRGAVLTAALFEGLAQTRAEAEELILNGQIQLAPCHEYQCVGPMTGVITYSMPLWKVVNTSFGVTAYSTLNEGMGDVLRFGGSSDEVVNRLQWLKGTVGPLLEHALNGKMDGLERPSPLQIMAKSLHMGDELHMRNSASSSLLTNQLIPLLVKASQQTGMESEALNRVLRFLTVNNEQFFLNLGMAAAKAIADCAAGIPYSTIIHRLCRNGTEIGMQIASLPDQWFTAKAAQVEGLFFSGFHQQDANRDIGDSAIMEVVGLGGMSMASSPSIVKFLGSWTADQALQHTRSMYEITHGSYRRFQIPQLNSQGAPLGIDLIKVLQKALLPLINTAIIHKEAGRGMIGAGMAPIPGELFEEAMMAFGNRYISVQAI